MKKSTWLNSKRVFLNILGLMFLGYVPIKVSLTAPWVQAVYILSGVFMILSSVLGISWSEKGLGVIQEVTTDVLRLSKPEEKEATNAKGSSESGG